jgi:hypothetical protein
MKGFASGIETVFVVGPSPAPVFSYLSGRVFLPSKPCLNPVADGQLINRQS